MKKLVWILFLFLLPFFSEATHQVSGYLSIEYLSGYTYRIRLYDYTNICNTEADRDTIRFYWGDHTSTVVPRRNGSVYDAAGYPQGVQMPCDCRKVSIYDTVHTFPGPGTYHIWMDDQDRMANIVNMTSSVTQDFYLYTTLTIDPFVGAAVNSPIITNPPACVYACPGECYYFNLGAYSPKGDSLSYFLGNCLTLGGIKAAGYYVPSVSTIDNVTGTLKWCSPPYSSSTQGIYNYAIYIVTYKKALYGKKLFIRPVDTTEVELEIIVDGNCTNDVPHVFGPDDTCVVAGDTLHLNYSAIDSDGDKINLVATGPPFGEKPPATVTSNTSPANPVKLSVNWITTCAEIRKSPYPLLVTATDIPSSSGSPLNAYKSTDIYVVGPAPTNVKANPVGNSVQLTWNPSPCTDAKGYEIFRHIGCDKLPFIPCQTGVPPSSGYTLIGTTSCWSCTVFTDNNGGRGLSPGVYYDYVVVAVYPDGSVSYTSNDTCVKLKRDVPVITNVSVDSTSSSNGRIFIRWSKPIAGIADFDTMTNSAPYKYVLMRASGINGNSFTTVATFTTAVFKATVNDTTYKDIGLNTQSIGYNYRVDFYSNNNFVGSSATASSIYLTVKPDNNMLHLSWQSYVPWADSSYDIYRENPSGPPFIYIATVKAPIHTYTDSNLTNQKTFCYYVKSKSYYSDTTILHPLYDSSEVMCAAPKDTIPPCAPKLAVNPLCDEYRDSLVWNNPDYTCPKADNRILYYKVYFTPAPGTDILQPIATIYNIKDTTYLRDSVYSIAGCFAVTAVDSFGNESPIDTVCVDNCPEYELPNVFTPNGDGIYDVFTPILPYRFIKDVDIHILDRWGVDVFHTIDPMVNWNGRIQNSGKECSDGVYYYVCLVHEIHIDGIRSRTLKGFVHLLR